MLFCFISCQEDVENFEPAPESTDVIYTYLSEIDCLNYCKTANIYNLDITIYRKSTIKIEMIMRDTFEVFEIELDESSFSDNSSNMELINLRQYLIDNDYIVVDEDIRVTKISMIRKPANYVGHGFSFYGVERGGLFTELLGGVNLQE